MAEPVTLEEARLHLRVDHTDEDALIGSLIIAARELAEHSGFWCIAASDLLHTISGTEK